MSNGDLNNDHITNISDLNLYLDNPSNYVVGNLNNIISNWNLHHPDPEPEPEPEPEPQPEPEPEPEPESDYIESTNAFVINAYNSVTKDGLTHGVNGAVSAQYTFTITDIDPNHIHFFEREYIIDWEDDPISLQHGGYYLDYNNTSHRNDAFIRGGGPMWWWYGGLTNETQYWRTAGRVTSSDTHPPGSIGYTVDLAFRKSHRMIFKFIDNTNYSVTHTFNGITYTHNIPTWGGWTFSDKSSIQFCYHMFYNGSSQSYTSPHNFSLTIVTPYLEPEPEP